MDHRSVNQVRQEAGTVPLDGRLSPAWEDYLKVIFEITAIKPRATTNDIATQMEVSPASATVMVQKMATSTPPLVVYQKYQGVKLTTEGRTIALEVIRHHRLLETFLQKVLGYSWDEVHGEADRLEHVITEEFEERIAQVLGNPTVDPHGEPIPNKDLHMSTTELCPLSGLRPGVRAEIVKVKPDEEGLLRYLSGIGLVLGAQVIITGYSAFDGNLTLRIGDSVQAMTLGERITQRVFVRQIG
jgi:DtxR family Mn-dependent transcriptional regulator